MSILADIAKELFGMFVADALLTAGILILVATIAWLIAPLAVDPVACGGLLLAGSVAILAEATARQARGAKHRDRQVGGKQ